MLVTGACTGAPYIAIVMSLSCEESIINSGGRKEHKQNGWGLDTTTIFINVKSFHISCVTWGPDQQYVTLE